MRPNGWSGDRSRRSISGSFVVLNFLMTGLDFGVIDEQHFAIWRIMYSRCILPMDDRDTDETGA